MVGFAVADEPDVVCLQEVPLWALRRLGEWSRMHVVGHVAARPRLLSAKLGRWITELHHGLLRSAVTGQGQAILVAPGHEVGERRCKVVSERKEGERRICQAVEVDGILVANFHVTRRLADDQFRRVVEFLESLGADRVLLCGDANVRPAEGDTYRELERLGYSPPLLGIDQILVRGLELVSGPEERPHTLDGVIVSDHAPIEAVVR